MSNKLTRTRQTASPALIAPLALIGAVIVVPILTLLYVTLTTTGAHGGVRLSFEAFQTMFSRLDFLHYAWNSVELSIIYIVPVVTTSFCAGYAFGRLKARGSKTLFNIVIATMLVPVFVYLIPLFVVYSRLGLTNTVLPWLFWGLSGNAFYIFLFRQFFDGFPLELEEAAMLDGLSRWQIITRIVVPNSYPSIATVAILAFTNVWGEVLIQSVLLYKDAAETLSVRVAQGVFDTQGLATLIPPTLAAVVLYLLPPVIVFAVFQRFIIQGVATTGLK
jgi:multiple sugar transport system permease protein